MKPRKMMVMGVSGCGKSTIGRRLARTLGLKFFDGDDFHSPESVKKMRVGIPLTDADRAEWLARLNQLLRDEPHVVLACSALKPEYRVQLSQGVEELCLIYLQGDVETIWQRYQQRDNHYFTGRSMLESQFSTLVEPELGEALWIDIRQSPDSVLSDILNRLPSPC
ncbi:gluconokinase [Photobacterium galatheae]|uniref:Gluconokinase n=1 Tax=Photobacterium galatheae TaxID=1654360 RepID=A0A066RSM4_9GAMM|nr:gluconokinase [Photobacterium galatheae]KDM90403.1 gluconate kinase [Photobacterium galatheae]MCM0147877.1 gluconokinase [Photobacterium galatheae]